VVVAPPVAPPLGLAPPVALTPPTLDMPPVLRPPVAAPPPLPAVPPDELPPAPPCATEPPLPLPPFGVPFEQASKTRATDQTNTACFIALFLQGWWPTRARARRARTAHRPKPSPTSPSIQQPASDVQSRVSLGRGTR
jgi:hypothetical protein